MQTMSGRWLISAFALAGGLVLVMVALLGLLRSQLTIGGIVERGLQIIRFSNVKSRSSMPLFDMEASFSEENEADFRCIVTTTTPSIPICIFLTEEDRYVSAQLAADGVWEPHIINLYQEALRNFPEALVLDLGAHVGVYTLLAAAMGHRVIAVEPAVDSCRRLVSSVRRANLSNLVTLVCAAVADDHYFPLVLDPKPGNKGGTRVEPAAKCKDKTVQLVEIVTMNDLTSLQPDGGVAIIKMDIEGYECKALATSQHFFRTFTVPYVFMEWEVMFRDRHRFFSPCRPVDLRATSDLLVSLKYNATSARNGVELDPEESSTNWRVSDILWRHAEAPQLSTYN